MLFSYGSRAAEPLWQLGIFDNSPAEFAFAPKGFDQIKEDGCFVPGESNPNTDWPYAQPGPADTWAGSRQHTYAVLFGLQAPPLPGTCLLRLDFVDTQHSQAPRLKVEVNGNFFDKTLQTGAGDESIYGDPSKGREAVWDVQFPSSLLRAGPNEISIKTLAGSWVIYDAVSLTVPGPPKLAALQPHTRIASIEAPPVWLKKAGAPVQPLNVSIRHFGPGVTATLKLGSTELQKVTLKQGINTLQCQAPVSEEPRKEKLLLWADGQDLASAEVTLSPPRIREMWLLPHSHVDIGYTHRQEEIVRVQITNLETSMRLARETAGNPPGLQFKWNPEAVWTLDHFLQQASPEKKKEFIEAVRRGEVGVDGLYGNLLTGLCRPEELAQGLAFGARLSNLTGVPVESASICDVPGWTWGIIPMMADAGIKYFAIGPNFGDRVGTIHVWDNKPFYWKSQSGAKRVLCWVVDNYHFCDDLEPHVLSQVQKLNSIVFPYDTSFMFWVGRGPGGALDNAPPDTEITRKATAWNEKYAAPKVVIGLAGEYFRTFERKHGAKVPEYAGDLTPYWEDGAGSTSRETAMNRASADRLSQAEAVFAMRAPHQSPFTDFENAWKNVLLYTEHTWGAWCSISRPDDPFTLDQWKVKQAFALDAATQSRALLGAAAPLPEKPDKHAVEIDVVNTTQWKRTGLAIVPLDLSRIAVADAKGKVIPSQQLASGDLAFLATDVPPFASKRYRLLPAAKPPKAPKSPKATAQGNVLRNELISVEIDPQTGAVKSLKRAGLKHEFVDPNAPVGLNDFRYVRGTDVAHAQPNGPVTVNVLENGPLVASLRIQSDAPGCNGLAREVRIVAGSDHVELVNHVDRKTVREKDAVHFGFGFHVPGGQIRMETPWAVVRPNIDQLPGSCRNWFTVQRWMEISGERCGVTWAPLDAPLVQIGGMTANLLGSVHFSEWMTNALESQTIYSWAQNNHWHTNYKIDQPGVTTFRFAMRPHAGGYSAMESARFGLETSRPLIVAKASREAGLQVPLVQLSSQVAIVETVKPSADGKAVIVRLFGVTGKDTSVRLNWRAPEPAAVYLTDLTERPLDTVSGSAKIPAFGVVHLRAELAAR